MRVVAAISFSLLFGSLLFGQTGVNFDFGARAGVPITKPLARSEALCCFTFTDAIARTFIAGPAFGVTFFDRMRVEFDGLHRPWREVEEDSTFPTAPVTTVSTTRIDGTIWDFPVTANYRFLSGAIRPYAGAGLVLLRSVSATEQMTRAPGTSPGTIPLTFVNRFSGDKGFPAVTAQAGLEWKHAHFVIRPEVRYSYWRNLTTSFGPIIQKNQVEFLVGLAFETSKNK
jgi:outer membrane protein W